MVVTEMQREVYGLLQRAQCGSSEHSYQECQGDQQELDPTCGSPRGTHISVREEILRLCHRRSFQRDQDVGNNCERENNLDSAAAFILRPLSFWRIACDFPLYKDLSCG